MRLYFKDNNYTLYSGSMLNLLDIIEKETVDSIVTDPPYELGFMNKSWDNAGISFQTDTWSKCLEVLKPGGYLVTFGGSRTYHRIACAIEDAGFEIRDCIMWLYGSGFPKNMNIGKKLSEWEGWGTCLKPAYEPIIIARKPFKGSLTDNLVNNGVGALNIDGCRVGNEKISYMSGKASNGNGCDKYNTGNNKPVEGKKRFPANVILTHGESDFEEVCGGMACTKRNGSLTKKYKSKNNVYGQRQDTNVFEAYPDEGSAARYFYCAKASKRDREEGLDHFSTGTFDDGRKTTTDNPYLRGGTLRKNIHPTVKPTDLMQYLVRLVTPERGTILDPFMGSGSTGKAVMYENVDRGTCYKFVGIELSEEYLPIAKARIDFALRNHCVYTIDDYVMEVAR